MSLLTLEMVSGLNDAVRVSDAFPQWASGGSNLPFGEAPPPRVASAAAYMQWPCPLAPAWPVESARLFMRAVGGFTLQGHATVEALPLWASNLAADPGELPAVGSAILDIPAASEGEWVTVNGLGPLVAAMLAHAGYTPGSYLTLRLASAAGDYRVVSAFESGHAAMLEIATVESAAESLPATQRRRRDAMQRMTMGGR